MINLKKNKVRLENSHQYFTAENIPFTRIDAVNGWDLDEQRISQVYDADTAKIRYKYPLVKPEIGCYLSHLEAWQKIVDSGADGGFVFEDDFIPLTPIAPIMEKLSSADQSTLQWDIVKLFSLRENPKYVTTTKLDETHNLIIPYQVPTCLLGYGITLKGAKHLIKTSVPFFRPVDEDHKFFWEKDLNIALVTPSPLRVGDQQTQTGTIGGERKNSDRNTSFNRITRSFKSLIYQLDYKTRLHFHRKFGSK
ncbi:MAG: glycosyltransferase family 25 protein [Hyphomicrobiales bacterium]|nr:glycosyltransferase family 25 protein [Hyphomicrobiales bacterium]